MSCEVALGGATGPGGSTSTISSWISPRFRAHGPYTDAERAIIGLEAHRSAHALISACPAHLATPLHSLPGLAASMGLGSIHLKEEGKRFGLKSFKALGGGYAVALHVAQALGADQAALERQVRSGSPVAIVFCCASDGNHGRAVAFAARHFGAKAVVFVHAGVSQARRQAITDLGAEVIEVNGNYDDSVRAAERAATDSGWTLIADTSVAGGTSTAVTVMQGYTTLVAEACDARHTDALCPYSHVFVQAGVGGLAAAVAGYLADRYGEAAPAIIVVEPASAACLMASASADMPVRLTGDLETLMAMLSCGEPSPAAWEILSRRADAFLAIEDAWAVTAMKRLLNPEAADCPLAVGESGAAGLAALMAVKDHPALSQQLQLDSNSRVLLIATESPTDAGRFASLTGHVEFQT